LATFWHALDRCGIISMIEKNRKIFCVGLMAELKIFRIFKEVIASNRQPFVDSLSFADL
jgi:hypothetical protein